MDLHAVPFPTFHQSEDSPFVDQRPTLPSRLHSTPSLPNLVVPHHYASLPFQGPARHRPHLRPLDLASSPFASPTKKDALSEISRRSSSLLTPPLTPSSYPSSLTDTPSTPPEPPSPLRWINTAGRDRALALASVHSAYTTSLKSAMGASNNPAAHNAGYLTPASARSQSLSSDDDSALLPNSVPPPDGPVLASGLASADITPRDERAFSLNEQDLVSDLDIGETSVDRPTRLLLVRHVPPNVPPHALREAFCGMGEVKGIFARFQASHGFVFLAFYDTRHAARALTLIAGNSIPLLGESGFAAAFVRHSEVEKVSGKSDFLSDLDGSFFVTVEAQTLIPKDIQNMLSAFGEIASFSGADPHDQTFHVEYYDCRDAKNAHEALNGRSMFGGRVTIVSNKDMLEHPVRMMEGDRRARDLECEAQAVVADRVRPRSVSAGGCMGALDTARRVKKEKASKEVSQDHGRRSSNDLFFDAVRTKAFDPSHDTSARPRSISASAEDVAGPAKMQQPVGLYVFPAPTYPYPEPSYGYPPPGVVQVPSMYPPQPFPYPMYGHEASLYGPEHAARKNYWIHPVHHPPPVDYYPPPAPRPMYPFPMLPTGGSPGKQQPFQRQTQEVRLDNPAPVPQVNNYGDTFTQGLGGGGDRVDVPQSTQRLPGAKNVLDTAAIENGVDTRTTVMIKNIPNKMNDRDLKGFIDRVCPRCIDFMYLRMDFQNGCNVGYAFVNFITVQDLLRFAKTQVGMKWGMYSSEKTLQMCYATYQGKESLVEKFKNSSIMDEQEAWRPRIYFSDGPNKGLPEPFPDPTHLRRKERSQHNRGALFVPGTHHQPSGGGALYHQRPPPRMSHR